MNWIKEKWNKFLGSKFNYQGPPDPGYQNTPLGIAPSEPNLSIQILIAIGIVAGSVVLALLFNSALAGGLLIILLILLYGHLKRN